MKIIEKQFQDKDTYIVGTLIENGCQVFTIDELDEICHEWEVPVCIRDEVRKAYEENSKTEEDWEALAKYPDPDVQMLVFIQDKALDTLVKSEYASIRSALVKKGLYLDDLINDESIRIRTRIVEQGYGLDILINDPEPGVRAAVARYGHGLDILINDPIGMVRSAVARRGHGLDILINDPEPGVRAAVASQSHGLDILINDPSKPVRMEASFRLSVNKNLGRFQDINPLDAYPPLDTWDIGHRMVSCLPKSSVYTSEIWQGVQQLSFRTVPMSVRDILKNIDKKETP